MVRNIKLLSKLTLILIFCIRTACAQHPLTGSINVPFLEHLIKTGVDSVRLAHGLPCLYNDTILYHAANFHAEYLREHKKLTHFQEGSRKTKTPQNRVDYFGGVDYMVGENVAYSYHNKRIRNKGGTFVKTDSYEKLARNIVHVWVHSPGHYKNMITVDYEKTGLAVSIDKKTNRVYAVQKFASIPFQYSFKEDSAFFSYTPPEYPKPSPSNNITTEKRKVEEQYHFTDYDTAYQNCIVSSNSWHALSRLEYSGSKVFLRVDNADDFRGTIQEKFDGICMETVDFETYVCDNPAYSFSASRRNHQSSANGKFHKVFYKKDLQKGYKRGRKIDFKARYDSLRKIEHYGIWKKIAFLLQKRYEGGYFKLKIGDLKEHENGSLLEPNIIIINNKRACNILRYTNYSGSHYTPNYEVAIPAIPVKSMVLPTLKDTFKYNVSFAANQVLIGETQFDQIVDTILSVGMSIDSVFVLATSSVEGNEKANKELQLLRSQNMLQQLQGIQQKEIKIKTETQNSWQTFYEQLRQHEGYSGYAELSIDQLKKRLRETSFRDSVKHFLAEQRFAHLTLYTSEDTLTKEGLANFLVRRLNNHLSDLSTWRGKQLPVPKVDTMLFLHRRLLTIDYAKYSSQLDPFIEKYKFKLLPLLVNNLVQCPDSASRYLFLQKLKDIIIKDNKFLNITSNLKQLFMASYMKLPDDKKKNILPYEPALQAIRNLQFFPVESHQDLKKMELKMNYLLADQYFSDGNVRNKMKHKNALFAIYDLTPTLYPNNDSVLLKTAQFFTYHKEVSLAYLLLDPRAKRINPDKEILFYHTLLGYHYNGPHVDRSYEAYLLHLEKLLGSSKWCDLFVGNNRLSFQLFDSELLRNKFCKECGKRLEGVITEIQSTAK